MNHLSPRPTVSRPTTKSTAPEPYRFPRFWIYVLLGGMGLVIGYQILDGFSGRSPASTARATADKERAADDSTPQGVPLAETKAPVREVTVNRTSVTPRAPAAAPDTVQAQPAPQPPPPLPASAVPAQQLIAQLVQGNAGQGVMTAEQAQELKQKLATLTQQGADAVPAIREFLDKNQDLSFGEGSAKLVGYSSLRTGLLDSLRQIGGPEAVAVSRQVLQTTADPVEIAMLAQNLEQAAPGQYREEALTAARETLAQITEGKVVVKDAAPLFQVLQTYGDASVAADLARALPKYSYYAVMALAGLPEGAGIPSLIQLTQDTAAAGKAPNKFALQMMAQDAAQYPAAGATLVDLARQNQIPDSAWRLIGEGLGGDQYQYSRQLPDNTFPIVSGPGVKTYHIEYGNQNFYSTAFPEKWSQDEIDQRRALIDRLLAANSSPVAANALQQARAGLEINKPGK